MEEQVVEERTFQESLVAWAGGDTPRMTWGNLDVRKVVYGDTLDSIVVRATIAERQGGGVGLSESPTPA